MAELAVIGNVTAFPTIFGPQEQTSIRFVCADEPVNRIDSSGHESLVSIQFTAAIMGQFMTHELRTGHLIFAATDQMFGVDDGVHNVISVGQGGATDCGLLMIKENSQRWDRAAWITNGDVQEYRFKP